MIGHKEVFGIELGNNIENSPDLFELNIWFIDKHVTRVDNIAYLKSVIYQAEDDIREKQSFEVFSKYFEHMSPEEAHRFILSTRDQQSKNFDIENDEIYPNQQVLNWGPNTDNVACFIVPINGINYATLEYYDRPEEVGTVFTKEIDLSNFNNVLKEFFEYGKSKI